MTHSKERANKYISSKRFDTTHPIAAMKESYVAGYNEAIRDVAMAFGFERNNIRDEIKKHFKLLSKIRKHAQIHLNF